MGRTGFLYHPTYLKHDTGQYHPESPDRLMAIEARVKKSGLIDELTLIQPPGAARAEIDRWIAEAHRDMHVERIRSRIPAAGQAFLDPDTPVSPLSYLVGQLAVEGTLVAADRVMSGELDHVFCAVRPPGHHAESTRPMGFCLFNNIAVCARYLQHQYGLKKVAIIDWDVHHGNGTQDIFYDDPNVLYISTHESPLYPGTGAFHETGAGSGVGANVNLPFPAGTAGDTYRAAFDEVIVPLIERFAPDWLFISAGFDAHRADPLAGLGLTAADYADLAVRLQSLVPARRLLVVLEGGYHLEALTYSSGATLSALLGEHYRPELASGGGDTGRQTVTAAKQLWEL